MSVRSCDCCHEAAALKRYPPDWAQGIDLNSKYRCGFIAGFEHYREEHEKWCPSLSVKFGDLQEQLDQAERERDEWRARVDHLRTQLEVVVKERDEARIRRDELIELRADALEQRNQFYVALQKSLAANAILRRAAINTVQFFGMGEFDIRIKDLEKALSCDDGAELLSAVRGAIENLELLTQHMPGCSCATDKQCMAADSLIKIMLQALRKALGEEK